eukprot:5014739-Prymnesium_polylepis.1
MVSTHPPGRKSIDRQCAQAGGSTDVDCLRQSGRNSRQTWTSCKEHIRRQTVAYEAVRHGGAMPESINASQRDRECSW